MASDESFLAEFHDIRDELEQGMARQHRMAKECLSMYAGNEYGYQVGQEGDTRNLVMINKAKSYIDSVGGFMAQNRRKPKYEARVPNNEQQELYSFYVNGVSDFLRDHGHFDQVEGQQDKQMLICGYSAVETALLFGEQGATRDPNGELAKELIPYNKIYWDTQARGFNLLDCKMLMRKKEYRLKDALELFKGSTASDFDLGETEAIDMQYFPGGGTYDRIGVAQNKNVDLVQVYNYQYWQREKYFRVANPVFDLMKINPALAQAAYEGMITAHRMLVNQTSRTEQPDLFDFNPKQQILIMTPQLFKIMAPLFGEAGISLEYDESYRRVYYTKILTDHTVFDTFKNIDQNGFSIKFKTADYDESNHCFFGMMQLLKVPLLYSNKVLTELLRIIASNSKGGLIYERSATNSPRDLERNWAKPDASIMLEDGGLAKVKSKTEPYAPNGYDQLLPLFDQYLSQVTVDKNFLGNSENRDEPAALHRQRIKQVVTVLATYFDAITLYQREDARMNLSYIRAMADIDPSRSLRLVGDDGVARMVNLSPEYLVDAYDIVITEAPDSATEKDEKLQYLTNFTITLGQLRPDLAPSLAAQVVPHIHFLTAQERSKLLQTLTPQPPSPEQQQVQQQTLALELADKKAQVDERNAHVQKMQAETAKIMAGEPEAQQEAITVDHILKNKELDIRDKEISSRIASEALKAKIEIAKLHGDALEKDRSHDLEKGRVGIEHRRMDEERRGRTIDAAKEILSLREAAEDLDEEVEDSSKEQGDSELAEALKELKDAMRATKKIKISRDANNNLIGEVHAGSPQ